MMPQRKKKCFRIDFIAYYGTGKVYDQIYLGVDNNSDVDKYIKERLSEDGEQYFKVIGIDNVKYEDAPHPAVVLEPY